MLSPVATQLLRFAVVACFTAGCIFGAEYLLGMGDPPAEIAFVDSADVVVDPPDEVDELAGYEGEAEIADYFDAEELPYIALITGGYENVGAISFGKGWTCEDALRWKAHLRPDIIPPRGVASWHDMELLDTEAPWKIDQGCERDESPFYEWCDNLPPERKTTNNEAAP